MKKKFLALVLTLAMVLSLVPMTALAAEGEPTGQPTTTAESQAEDAATNGDDQKGDSAAGSGDSTGASDTNTNTGNKEESKDNESGSTDETTPGSPSTPDTGSGAEGGNTGTGGTTEGSGTGGGAVTEPEKPEVPENAAKIADKQYETITAAIEAATANDTIVLLRNVTESITINKSLTLDLAGFTLTAEENNRVIDVTPEVALDVLELDFSRYGITDPYFPDIGFGIGWFREDEVKNIGKLEIPEVNVKIMNGIITGGDVSGRKETNLKFLGGGGGIRISSCNVEIESCTITGNKAESGGGIFCSTSVVNNQPHSKVVITDCVISNNIACDVGAAVISAGGGISSCRCDLTLNKLTVSNNKADKTGCDGGGISARGGKFYMQNTVVEGNEAEDNAGGILLGSMYDNTIEEPIEFEISGGVVQKNSCIRNNGGGIYLDTVNKEENRIENKINGTIVEENTASSGGGIYVGTRAKLTVGGNALIQNNKATYKYLGGGGIYATIADLHLGNASVTNNEATKGCSR